MKQEQQLPTYANVLITIFISLFAILILSFGFTLLWFTVENHNFAKELHQKELNEIEMRYRESEKREKYYDNLR